MYHRKPITANKFIQAAVLCISHKPAAVARDFHTTPSPSRATCTRRAGRPRRGARAQAPHSPARDNHGGWSITALAHGKTRWLRWRWRWWRWRCDDGSGGGGDDDDRRHHCSYHPGARGNNHDEGKRVTRPHLRRRHVQISKVEVPVSRRV